MRQRADARIVETLISAPADDRGNKARKDQTDNLIPRLRHTWASLAVMNGVPLMIVARNLGHADTRMVEQHYGHLAPDYVKEAIRKGAPTFGFKTDSKIATLR